MLKELVKNGARQLSREEQKNVSGGNIVDPDGMQALREAGDCIAVANAIAGNTDSFEFLGHYNQCMSDFEERR
ncbi:MAG: hypothetical protein JKY44_04390 [Flavobacteriaceae bacterium]|nr:hypothetical protein [Flavobacteriaceae bacterium]